MLSQCAWQNSCSLVHSGGGGGGRLLAMTLVEVLCGGQKQPCRQGCLVLRLCSRGYANPVEGSLQLDRKGIPFGCFVCRMKVILVN